MEIISETEEIELFNCKVVRDLIEFNWDSYAKHIHLFGAFIHCVYVFIHAFYIHQVYLDREYSYRFEFCTMMLVCLIYPMVYDMLQLYKQGPSEYFGDFWNHLDQAHIWCGVTNIVLQMTTRDIMSPESQTFMVAVTLLMLIKSFFFLRIF